MTDSDWRLQGQEKYLTGVTLYRKPYERHSAEWDHDHCEFCGAKFMEPGGEEGALIDGYATVDNYRWICGACCNDFAEQFRWTLKEIPADDSE